MSDKPATNTHAKRSQPDREALLAAQLRDTVERVEVLEVKLATIEKRLATIEQLLSREDDKPFYPEAGRDDTITLYTEHME